MKTLRCAILVLLLFVCSGAAPAGGISDAERNDLVHAPGTSHTWNHYSRSGVKIETFTSGHSAEYKVRCNNGSWEVYSATGICHLAKPQTCCSEVTCVPRTCWQCTENGTCTTTVNGIQTSHTCCTDGYHYDCSYYGCADTITCTRPQVDADPGVFQENRRTCSASESSPTGVLNKASVRPGNNARFCVSSYSDPDAGSTDISGAAIVAEFVQKPPYTPSYDDMIAMAPWADGFIEAAVTYDGGAVAPRWITRQDGGAKAAHYLMIPTRYNDFLRFIGSHSAIASEPACYRASPSAYCDSQDDCCHDHASLGGPC